MNVAVCYTVDELRIIDEGNPRLVERRASSSHELIVLLYCMAASISYGMTQQSCRWKGENLKAPR
jgi:hypothetical protein